MQLRLERDQVVGVALILLVFCFLEAAILRSPSDQRVQQAQTELR